MFSELVSVQNSLALPLLPPELRSPQLLRRALAQECKNFKSKFYDTFTHL